MNKFTLIILSAVFSISQALAFPKAPVDDLNFTPTNFKSFKFLNYNFEGIVKLSNCSGSLIKLEGQSANDKGLVLTNGHCVPRGIFGGFLQPGEVFVNKRIVRSMKVFKDKDTLFDIQATKIIYATMTDTDMAVYELSETFAEIEQRTGVRALTLASKRPIPGTNIEIISGYWERGYSCAIDTFIHELHEADWIFKDSVRYTYGCDTIGGTSGSPIIASGTREVIAVNNTSNVDGKTCKMNNPCEVDEFGDVYVEKGLRYGQQTYNLYNCLTKDLELNLNLASCNLPK